MNGVEVTQLVKRIPDDGPGYIKIRTVVNVDNVTRFSESAIPDGPRSFIHLVSGETIDVEQHYADLLIAFAEGNSR